MIGLLSRGSLVHASPLKVDFSENNQYIMTMRFEDGTYASDGLEVYQSGSQWFFPLTALVESLGLAVTVSPLLGQAEGFVIDESNLFSLDKSNCSATAQKQVLPFDCNQVVTFDDEIYVTSSLVEKWFSIRLKINSFASEIVIISATKFPKQLRQERDRQAESITSRGNEPPVGYEEKPLEDKTIGDGSFDQQFTIGQQKNQILEKSYFRHDTTAAIEILGFENKGFLGGENDTITQSSLSISKKDPQGKLLGAMGARSIELLDLTFPSIPLITSSVRTQGLLISSFPLNQPFSFSSKDFRGPLASNWEVELYQNDILIGRRRSDTATEYEFKEVTLYYGVNRFRLVFYGPQGQRKETIEVINVGQQSTRPAESYYRFGTGTKVDSNNTLLSVAQYKHGVSSNFAAGLSFFQENRQDTTESTNYGLIDFNGSFSRFFGTLNIAGNSHSGSAIEATVQAPFEMFVIGASHATLSSFRSSLFNSTDSRLLETVNKVNGNISLYSWLPIRLDGEIQQNLYDDKTESTEIKQRTSWQIGNSFWFNSLSQHSDLDNKIFGQLLTIFPMSRFEFRTLSGYQAHLDSFSATLEYRLTDKYTYDLEVLQNLKDEITTYTATLSRVLSVTTLSAELMSDSNGNYRAIGIISYSGTHRPQRNDFEWSPKAQTPYGAASARVFLDKDQNGVFSDGDIPLKDISLRVNQNDINSETDAQGYAMILNLPAHQDTDISLAIKSLPDLFYHPVKKGYRIIPRPGQVSQLDFPIVIQSEIDGMVQVEKLSGLRGLRNVTVQLKTPEGQVVASALTESDGFYFIQGVLPGRYELSIDEENVDLKDLEFEQKSYLVNVSESGLVESTFDFKASNKRPNYR